MTISISTTVNISAPTRPAPFASFWNPRHQSHSREPIRRNHRAFMCFHDFNHHHQSKVCHRQVDMNRKVNKASSFYRLAPAIPINQSKPLSHVRGCSKSIHFHFLAAQFELWEHSLRCCDPTTPTTVSKLCMWHQATGPAFGNNDGSGYLQVIQEDLQYGCLFHSSSIIRLASSFEHSSQKVKSYRAVCHM